MKNNFIRTTLFTVWIKPVIVMCLFLFCGAAIGETNQQLKIEEELAHWLTQYNIPGAVVSYKIAGQPTRTIAVGYASLSPKVAMQEQDLFLAGSITKSFIAAIVLKLAETEALSLNENLEHIAQVYPGQIRALVAQYPALKPMTVKQLLNHTSGVPQSINTLAFQKKFVKNPHKYYTPQALMQIAMQHSVYFKPGEKGKWSYTNTDYLLLGLIIEDVTKKSLNDNFTALFFSLGIKDIYFADQGLAPKSIKNRLVLGYLSTEARIHNIKAFSKNPVVTIPGEKKQAAYQLKNSYNIFSPAASGVIASAPALVAYYQALFEKNFLSKDSIKEMLQTIPNGKYNHAGYGLGITVHSYPEGGWVISHDGLEPGYSTIVMFFKKYKLIVVIATNSSNDKVSTFNVHTGAIMPGLITHIFPYLTQ